MKPFAALTLSLSLALPLFALAQDMQVAPTPVAVVSLPDAGTLPGSTFYFLKSWKEGVELLFTFGAKANAKRHLQFAEVRLAEYQKLIENGDIEEATATLKEYQDHRDTALEKAKNLNEQDAAEVKVKEDADSTNLQAVLKASLEKIPQVSNIHIEGTSAEVQVQ
jgi:hypothetical protein